MQVSYQLRGTKISLLWHLKNNSDPKLFCTLFVEIQEHWICSFLWSFLCEFNDSWSKQCWTRNHIGYLYRSIQKWFLYPTPIFIVFSIYKFICIAVCICVQTTETSGRKRTNHFSGTRTLVWIGVYDLNSKRTIAMEWIRLPPFLSLYLFYLLFVKKVHI